MASSDDLLPLSQRAQVRRFLRALGMLLGLTAIGTVGFAWIEGWSPGKALFLTLMTITSVGYGDLRLSEAGMRFGAFLLVVGLGVFSYAFAMVLQTVVESQFAWRRRMEKRIRSLEGHTIVCGYGRMGRILCRELAARGVAVGVIDQDEARVREAIAADYLAIQGSACENEALVRAGIESAAHVVVAVSREFEAIVIAMSARELRSDVRILARAATEEGARKLRVAGADRVVLPYQSGARELFEAVADTGRGAFAAGANLRGAHVVLGDLVVSEGSVLEGKSLEAYGRREGQHIAFVALERRGSKPIVPPGGSTRLQAGDHLIVAGDPEEIARLRVRARERRAAA
jgi:voltage-gated potassium channel